MAKIHPTEDALRECGARVNPRQEGKLKGTLVMSEVNSPRIFDKLEMTAPRLFNLEPYSEPEKPLGIKLDLYQMESH